MPSPTGVQVALELSREQLHRLEAGDYDRFLAAAGEHEAACARLHDPADVPPDAAALAEVVATNARILDQMDGALAVLRDRIATLREARRASSAYGFTPDVEPALSGHA